VVLVRCLEIFSDGYFSDVHNDVVILLTEIFKLLRPISDCTRTTLLQLALASVQHVDAFEVSFASKSTSKEQLAVVRLFLRNLKGVSEILHVF
jgi:exportin-5